MNLSRTLAVSALAVVGAFLFFVGAAGYGPGFPREGIGLSLIAGLSILCLLGAAVTVLRSFRASEVDSRALKMTYAAIFLGLWLALASQLIPFPVGCNLTSSCQADPEGAWSTMWPNALSACMGAVLVTTGYGKLRSKDAVLPGLGVGLIVSGFFLLVWGLSIGYFTSCPANGCPPLTGSQWWSLFWPDVIADILGISCMVSGSTILIMCQRLEVEQTAKVKLSDLTLQA